MQNIPIKTFLFILIGMSALVWIGLAYYRGLDLSKFQDFVSLIPNVVTIDALIIAVFVKIGWKLPIFRGWLVTFPNLNGTWTGSIFSDWINPDTGEKVKPIPVMLTIKQTFFHINCSMHTYEMHSSSYAEGFEINPDRQIKQLAYSYMSKPRTSVSNRSTPHDGTAVFQIIEKPNKKLKGRYWTERMTKGEIILEFHSKDMLEELPQGLESHPVTEKTS